MEYLEEAGIADKTVIAMAPDHIPYSDLDVLEELAGHSFNADSLENLDEKTVDTDVYRNTWILWSGSMEEPIVVDKPCSQVDILPTLSNLLGLKYDSRVLVRHRRAVRSRSDCNLLFEFLAYREGHVQQVYRRIRTCSGCRDDRRGRKGICRERKISGNQPPEAGSAYYRK